MNNPASIPASQLKRARLAVMAIFFSNGALLASFYPHVPYIQEKHQLSEGVLGLALLSASIGAICMLLFTGWLISHFGSRVTTRVASLVYCCMLPLPILAPNLPLLMLSMVFFGASNSLMDVSMNTQAIAIEKGMQKPIISSFHALFSLGNLAGAGLGAISLSLGMIPGQHVLIVSAVIAVILLVSIFYLLPSTYDGATQTTVFILPGKALMVLSLIGLGSMLSEGAIGDWSAVYMRNNLATSAALAASGFTAYSLTMTIGRITGDRLRAWLGSVRLVRYSAALACLGLGVALVVGNPYVAILGFALVGIGLSNIVPIVFSAAGNVPGVNAGTGIAAVASIGYLGGLAGPPVIGFTAQATSLPIALGFLVLILGFITVFAGKIKTGTI